MDLKNYIVQAAHDLGGKLTVKSALNPILWLCALIAVPGMAISAWAPNPPAWIGVMTCIVIITAILGFLFLLIFDRDKLQSESYQLRKQTLELIENKGDIRPINANEIEAIANPDVQLVEYERGDDK